MKRESSIAVALLGTLVLAGCSMLHRETASTASGSGPAKTDAAPTGDARQNVGDALRKLQTAYPYRLTETTSTTINDKEVASVTTRVVEFAAADRSHAVISGGSGGNYETITIGDKRYWKTNGTWTEGTAPSNAARAKFAEKMEGALASMTKDVKSAGSESVNGVACYVYAYTIEMKLESYTFSGTGKTWIGTADGLPHQTDYEMKTGMYNQKSHVVYEYNVSAKIEKPIP